jgi:serine/threonine protein kinase
MPIKNAIDLIEVLRPSRLLNEEQRKELPGLAARFPDAVALARELVKRNWLTTFQFKRLAQGKPDELLLGQYALLEPLGEGGMGQVFKAKHVRMERIVALKVIRKERLENPDAVRRFEREIQAAAKLSHPNVVLAFDADRVGNTHFFAMEYVEGKDLGHILKESGRLPVQQACAYMRQAGLGLQHAHERGMVHRDIKPSNLLVSGSVVSGQRTRTRLHDSPLTTHQVKILDMGLARLQLPVDDGTAATSLTQMGSVIGTVDYLAPEQALNPHEVDIRADLYSLGCTFYHALTGDVPFTGSTAMEKIFQHRDQEPRPLQLVNPEVPAPVADVVARLMAKRRDDRYQTPADFVRALEDALQVRNGEAAPKMPSGEAPTAAEPAPFDSAATHEVFASLLAADNSLPAAPHARGRQSQLRRRLLLWGVGGGAALVASLLIFLFLLSRTTRPGATRRPPDEEAPGLNAALAAFRPLLAKAENPKTNADELRQALLDFRVQFPGTPQARRAGELFGTLPSPLDKMELEKNVVLDRFPNKPKELVAVLGRPKPRQDGPVYAVAVNPDGRLIATGGQDTHVHLWSGATGKEQDALAGHAGPVTSLAFSPDGKLLASASHDGTVRLWDVATNAEKSVLRGHERMVLAVAFAPDGKTLASASQDQTVRVWDSVRGQERLTLKGHTGSVCCVAFSPDGKRLASGGEDQTLRLWNLGTPGTAFVYEGHKSWVYAAAFSPDGQLLVSGGGGDGTLRLGDWNGATLVERSVFLGHSSVVTAAGFTPDGKSLFSTSRDGRLTAWDLPNGNRPRDWRVPNGLYGLALALDGRHVATASANGLTCLFRYADAPRR